ncbi:GNAT family N-acetyltransferase [Psychromonas aquimarina]|uniref:GNAT family N-acetyltransferase n=1 Tax=Psychromonas aquimarina TaxID=444919 RepID=UPI0004066C9D|nr:GNAT family N-acetyltransferase [Psychromonas aquimarina]
MYEWHCKKYDQLSLDELYEILKIRQEIFIVEQDCAYLDADGLDKNSWHLFAQRSDDPQSRQITAYLRVVFPKHKYQEPSIGRALTSKESRGTGLGKELTKKALLLIEKEYPNQVTRISAPQYLQRFYEELGFTAVCKPYDEDGIAHIEMLKSK